MGLHRTRPSVSSTVTEQTPTPGKAPLQETSILMLPDRKQLKESPLRYPGKLCAEIPAEEAAAGARKRHSLVMLLTLKATSQKPQWSGRGKQKEAWTSHRCQPASVCEA